MIYDYLKEKNKGRYTGKIIIGLMILAVIILLIVFKNIYMEIIQLDEIGNYSGIYLTNLLYKLIFSIAAFVVIFIVISVSNIFIKKNIKQYAIQNSLPSKKLPNYSISAVVSILGALICKDVFYQKALNFFNAAMFGKTDPLFGLDIGYYTLQRPFLLSIYDFIYSVGLFVIFYTITYYIAVFFTMSDSSSFTLQDLKVKSIIRHNLINIAVFFVIKAFSYRFLKEGILFSNVLDVKGAGYIDVNIWLNYFKIAPFLLIIIVMVSLIFTLRSKLKKAAVVIAAFPAIWLITVIIVFAVQSFVVNPNEYNLESKYIKLNMQKTREAYNIGNITQYEFPSMQVLTPQITERNIDTINDIRVVDYQSTLISDVQLQSIKNFYSFNDGDIINYTINGKEIPVFITAREIDKNKLPDSTYLNTLYKYTHGYGVVINPINKITAEGQIDFIMSELSMKSIDNNLKITEPRLYYGELTGDPVIVNAANNLNEIDYDGNAEVRYAGKGGIKLDLLNKLLFSLKYGDFNMLISGYSSKAKLLLNREIISRAQKAVPFLTVDRDPYIILTDDGRLKWVLDAYTTSSYYPYSQDYSGINYVRNSVKIVIDAYDGKVKYYVIDKNDPLIKTYEKIYPGVFSADELPDYLKQHSRYPELLFEIQTEILKKYHLDPDDVLKFYTKQDLWDIAKYPGDTNSTNVVDIDSYYNMIKLPGGIGQKEELILMRPFTPSNKNNMVSWLSVRNSYDNYGQLILFNFPKNNNVFGPYQVEVKINQIDKVSKDMTLWGQSGSDVYKGSLLVIPIENSILYVEPIYIKASGGSSIPEVREIIVGYQSGDEFKYGIGTNLKAALADLFTSMGQTPATPAQPAENNKTGVDEKVINDIISKYDTIKKQLDDLGNLINELRK